MALSHCSIFVTEKSPFQGPRRIETAVLVTDWVCYGRGETLPSENSKNMC